MYGAVQQPKVGLQRVESGCVPGCNCIVTVPQDRWYVVEKLGSFDRYLGPGLSCVGFDLCGLCLSFRSITSRVEQNECVIETKTKDNVFVVVKVAVQQSVIPDCVQAAMYKLADVSAQIDSYVADVVRSHLPKMTLDEAFEKKDSISDAVQESLSQHMRDYGFMIHKALVTEVKPNQEVVNAMNEINKQRRLRDATQMAADAEKIRVVTAAEAMADAARLQGEGIARQRSAIVEGLREAIGATGEKLSNERTSELLLISQYFETLKELGASEKANVVFLPHGSGGDMAGQIRAGILQGGVVGAPGQTRM